MSFIIIIPNSLSKFIYLRFEKFIRGFFLFGFFFFSLIKSFPPEYVIFDRLFGRKELKAWIYKGKMRPQTKKSGGQSGRSGQKLDAFDKKRDF
jgi:hypothetical protein